MDLHSISFLWAFSLLEWQSWLLILQVALGLSAVIFVHELGHFVVAKLCGVKCEKFYIGFDIAGLKLFKFQWGETEYGIGILPLGGYVKMLGQEDNPARVAEEMERAKLSGEGEGAVKLDPRSYLAQSVPERMAIISAGVVMNVIFAFVFASFAYSRGVEVAPAVIGSVMPGEAAWQAGLQPGDEVLQINDRPANSFSDISQSVALGDVEGGLKMLIRRPGVEEPFTLHVFPARKEDGYAPRIGAGNSFTTVVRESIAAVPGTSAAQAQPAFEPGDRITAIDGQTVETYQQLRQILNARRSEPLTFTVSRRAGKDKPPQEVQISVAPQPVRWFGLETEMGPVTAIRAGSPAEKAGVKPGDRIVRVNGEEPGDPLKLPQRFDELVGQDVELEVSRAGSTQTQVVQVQPEAAGPEEPQVEGSPLSIPSLGLAYTVTSRVTAVAPDSPAAKAGIKAGDVVVAATIIPPDKAELKETNSELQQRKVEMEFSDAKPNWPRLFFNVQQLLPGSKIELTLEGGRKVELDAVPQEGWYYHDRGLVMEAMSTILKAQSLGEALRLGGEETLDSLLLVVRFLRKLGTQVSPLAMGGPGTIFVYAAHSAQQGLSAFLIFLCMLSANLAVINFLPIPVLDGGHMMFLAYEGITGKPVNERVFMTLTYAGFLFILLLMLFVVGLDVERFLF